MFTNAICFNYIQKNSIVFLILNFLNLSTRPQQKNCDLINIHIFLIIVYYLQNNRLDRYQVISMYIICTMYYLSILLSLNKLREHQRER